MTRLRGRSDRFGRLQTLASRRVLGVLAVLCVGAALGYLVQGPYSGSLAQYALVKALARGTAVIDETRFETGTETTLDLVYVNDHYYAGKAPGLAFVVLPAYVVLERAGVRTTGNPNFMLWALSLVGAVLPATLLLLVVRAVANAVEPGYGTVAAVTLGLGTLLTPFATMLYPHALDAFLVFGAFALLFFTRGRPRAAAAAVAGAAVGYAVATEYIHVLALLPLGAYATRTLDRWRHAVAFAVGFGVGVVPLLLYNWIVFGSPTHHSYSEAGRRGDVVNLVDAIGGPSFSGTVELLLQNWALLTMTPVLVCGGAGVVLLYRRGYRAEAVVIAWITVAYPVFISAWVDPSGSVPPGPRHLIPLLPFLAVGLATAFRTIPLTTAALALGSIAVALAVTAAHPLEAWDGRVLDRLTSPGLRDYSLTVVDQLAVVGWYRMVPFFVAVAVAIACAIVVTPRPRTSWRDAVAAVVALAGWGVTARWSKPILESDRLDDAVGALVVTAFAAAAVAAVVAVQAVGPVTRRRPRPS